MKHLFLFSLLPFLQQQFHEHQSLIILIVIGMVAGLIAQMILPGRGFGFIATIIIGVAGALLGHKYIRSHLTFIDHAIFREIASATLGAMILCIIVNIARGGKDRDKTHYQHN